LRSINIMIAPLRRFAARQRDETGRRIKSTQTEKETP